MDYLYEFVFRGNLAEESLDRAGRKTSRTADLSEAEVAQTLCIHLLDDIFVEDAKKMSVVFIAVTAFENSVRELVAGVMLEGEGDNWWSKVPKSVRESAEKRMEDEKQVRWHTQRGLEPINYTTLGNLIAIMRSNWSHFEAHIHSLEWATNVFEAIERSRNVIMHSGNLEREDIERLGIYIRDWIKQVGA